MKEKIDLKKYEHLFSLITNRKNPVDSVDKYEHLAFLVVDFTQNPPKLHTSIPSNNDLKIDNFFDKILATYKQRQPFLEIDK